MAQDSQTSSVVAVGDGAPVGTRFTFSPYCDRCGQGVKCWRAFCSCWGPLARHARSKDHAAEMAGRWCRHHVCGLMMLDRMDERRGEHRRELAAAAENAGLLF